MAKFAILYFECSSPRLFAPAWPSRKATLQSFAWTPAGFALFVFLQSQVYQGKGAALAVPLAESMKYGKFDCRRKLVRDDDPGKGGDHG